MASSSSTIMTADMPASQGSGSSHAPETNKAGDESQKQDDDAASAPEENSDGNGADGDDSEASPARRYLRVRDFNPYVFVGDGAVPVCAKKRDRAVWHEPRLVTRPSTTHVKGVFTKDIVSSLPYMEIISKEKFEVTDVMMDDCRLLLLKVCSGVSFMNTVLTAVLYFFL